MEKEFVNYNQALKLKELGFDEPCFGYWNKDPQLKNPTFNMVKPFEHEWCLPAPTYSQAFRWFREKYRLHTYIDGAYPWFRYYINSEDDRWEGHKHLEFEEAELACLDKLIEIVESKSE